jgi:nitrite reductase/ring-hydroxylating ferredoxin subunit
VAGWVKAGRVSDFEPGALRPVDAEGRDIAVVLLDGHFYAFSNFCTHEAVTFTSGYGVVRDSAVLCMMHGSWFDIETGEVPQRTRARLTDGLSRTHRGRRRLRRGSVGTRSRSYRAHVVVS